MNTQTSNLEPIAEEIHKTLAQRDAAREKALPLARGVIRHSSLAIRAIHRQEFDRAAESLESAKNLLTQIKRDQTVSHELFNTSFVRDAEKEFAEGHITLALATGKELPEPADLEVDPAAYLNGLGEAAGELRRYLLDSMRKGDLSRGEELLAAMDDIYCVLVTMDFPDAITGGLRRNTDMVRGVLERTRSDLTLVIRQKELEEKLKKVNNG